MLNDRTSTLSLLETRRSGIPRAMTGPGPTDAELEQILRIAARVPDHGKLHPWRFVVVADEQREQLRGLLRQALDEHDPNASAAHQHKEDAFANHGGTLVVLVSSPVANHKIPVWEQELSCGAAAMNLLTAAHALGYVGGWLTGWRAYSPLVTSAFCNPGERVAGFIFIGQPGCEPEERLRPSLEQVVSKWAPPSE